MMTSNLCTLEKDEKKTKEQANKEGETFIARRVKKEKGKKWKCEGNKRIRKIKKDAIHGKQIRKGNKK